MINLIFFRHGEIDANKTGIYQGDKKNPPLNKEGVKQAKDLSKKLENMNIDVVLSSDLLRSKQTAEIININNVDIYYSDQLREMNFGNVVGKTLEEVRESHKDIMKIILDLNNPQTHEARLPGGESRREAVSRVINYIDQFISNNPNINNIGISVHGGIMHALMKYLFNKEILNLLVIALYLH